ncbi:MgtC/SapB family protein [Arthrobacter sp. I2-34]|uniref:MgtC/SapB family protein n=1 Tax=Arthrobacter hankyongi TaxID=2904801 RepID=A0ABS9L4S5_9MICC|nr:MgtC/SapB family protein [Arthrobacter hankyongi]MCG2621479.1 MgtC/SapB family protein [Arthrobacter hankyongi]
MLQIDFLPATAATQVAQLLLAFVLSGIVGIERERNLKSAGLRTHILVGMGAALFTLVSAYGFTAVTGDNVVLDPARIAAQVVSGIGFLGAGVIFVRRNAVTGLTTAASIWMTAAIGMACAAGMPLIAVLATLLEVVTVGLLKVVSRFISSGGREHGFLVRYQDRAGVLKEVLARSAELGFAASLTQLRKAEPSGGLTEAELHLERGGRAVEDLAEGLAGIDGVVSIRLTDPENS